MKEISLYVLFSFCFAVSAICQTENPVNWTVNADVTPDIITITYTADIDDKWYVYSQHMESDMGPIPTSINLESKEIAAVGEIKEVGEKIEAYDEFYEMDITKYAKSLKLVHKIKNKPGLKNIKGYIKFMTCDSHRCLPPANVDFDLEVN